jgi:hypothetical protein
LFYSVATKIQEKPKDELIPPKSLTEIEDDYHKVLASKLIRILINPNSRLQVGTLLMHPLFTQCSGDARLRLNNDEISLLWKDKQKLLLWEKYLGPNKSKFADEIFDDFKDIVSFEINGDEFIMLIKPFILVAAFGDKGHAKNSERSIRNRT